MYDIGSNLSGCTQIYTIVPRENDERLEESEIIFILVKFLSKLDKDPNLAENAQLQEFLTINFFFDTLTAGKILSIFNAIPRAILNRT